MILTALYLQVDGLTEACGDSPGIVCEAIFKWTDSGTAARVVEWVLAKPVKVILILVIAYVLNRVVRRGIRRLIDHLATEEEEKHRKRTEEEAESRFAQFADKAREKTQFLALQSNRRSQRTEALGSVLRSISSLVIYTVAILMVLGEFQINLGPLLAGAGIVGVAIGFGAQTLVRDFIGGIFMLVEDQYGVGDAVDLGDAAGVVEEVRLRTTRIRDGHGTVWFIANGDIRRVANKSQQWARALLDIEVAYDTDIDQASSVIKEVADSLWQDQLENATVLEEPTIWGVQDFGPSAIAIRVALKTEPGEQFATAREFRRRLKPALDAAGIEIPFPQHTVWLRPDSPSATLPPVAGSDTGDE